MKKMGYFLIIIGAALLVAGIIVLTKGGNGQVTSDYGETDEIIASEFSKDVEATPEEKGKAFEDFIVRLFDKNTVLKRRTSDCRVQAQMQHETKLVKKFEEFDDWGREVEFFSWSPVDFLLYVEDCIVGESGEIG